MLGKAWLWQPCEVMQCIDTLWVVLKPPDSGRNTWQLSLSHPIAAGGLCVYL